MIAYWKSLQFREKLVLIAASITILLLLIYLQLIEPFYLQKRSLVQRVDEGYDTLQWISNARDEVLQIRSKGGTATAVNRGSLLSIVDQSSRKNNLADAVDRIQPDGARVQIWFKKVAFDQLMIWIGELKSKYQISVDTLAIDKADEVGLVDARLVVGSGL